MEIGSDTMYVYPGQYWYDYDAYYTKDDSTYLPNMITAADMRVNDTYGDNPNGINTLDFSTQAPSAPWPDTIGVSFLDSSGNSIDFRWYSNTSVGVDWINGFWRNGYNNDTVGSSRLLWNNTEIVYYSPALGDPRDVYFSSYIYVQCVDGIRGDVDGDGLVTGKDFSLMDQGQQDNSQMYHHSKVDFGRGDILFSWPTRVDTWLINVWRHTPDDPLVKTLGIGQPMSQRFKPLPQESFTTSVTGQNLTIKTKAFAVHVSTMLPGGKTWHEAAFVVNGQAVIQIPDAKLKYSIEAVSIPGVATGVTAKPEVPAEFQLSQNYPNPFNPTTTINYSLPKAGLVSLMVYNTLGQEVMSLVNTEMPAGAHQATFNAGQLASGTYFYRLVAGNSVSVKKMVLMK